MALDYEYGTDAEEHISSEDFLTNERDARRRARAAKAARKRYKFSDKEHSVTGIISSLLALTSLIFLIGAIVVSAIFHGAGGSMVGWFGAVSFVLSFAGIICGLVSFHNTDALMKYAWLGLISSGILWLVMGLLIVFGL